MNHRSARRRQRLKWWQRPVPPRSLLWLALACVPAMALEGTAGRGLSIVPTFTAATTYNDIRGTSSSTNLRTGTEWVSQVGPGVQINSRSGRVQGQVDYSLLGTFHSRYDDLDTLSNALAANLRAEAVTGWLYVDASANISQQPVSAFALQSAPGSVRANDNLREVATVSVSPYVRGEIGGGFADYELRLTGSKTDTRESSIGDSTNLLASQSLRSRGGTRFGWSLQTSQQRVDFRETRPTDLYRGVAAVNWAADQDLVFTARAGRESTNVGSALRQSYDNWGLGVRWTPTPRTLISVDGDRRYFGNGHSVVLEHRMRRTALRYTSVRDTTSGGDALGVGQPVTLFQLFMLQYASIEPDVVQRELRVRELLRLTGQNPNTLVTGGIAGSGVQLQRRQDLSFSWVGVRSNFTAQAFRGQTELIDRAGAGSGTGPQGRVQQEGATLTATHRLTPLTSMNLSGSYQRSVDSQGLQPSNTLRSVSLGLTTALNRNTTATLGARHSEQQGAPFNNRETSVSASLNVRF